MIHKLHVFLSILVCFLTSIAYAQTTDVVHYTQFNGRYDFLMFGNTLNTAANGTAGPCVILTESSADFTLVPGQEIAAAYLYWSGSGGLNDADLDVKLNGIDITAERTWTTTMGTNANLNFFGAFADVTEHVQNTGIGEYTFSDMDLTQVIQPYCSTGLNYGGWAVVVVYQDMSLPNNAVTIYDGFQRVDSNNQNVTMTLSGINVVDPLGARTGFLAWEGDENISVTEELRINNNLISNPPLNPANNAFNCTNSWTGASDLWNMDLDFFDISDYIDTGDTSLDVQLRSGQDGVIINCVVVSLNSELPDATITIDDVVTHCERREVDVEYTVYNTNATLELPANTPISFYINDTWTASTITQGVIPIDGSESGEITLTVPASISDTFVLKIVVDDDGSGDGIVNEIDETNNEAEQEVTLVFCTDLAITKTAIQDQDDYYFAITVTNIQGLPDSEIEVIDVLPSGYTFVSSTSTQGIYDNETGVWIVGDLDSGASATLRIYVNINDTGSYLNEATVSGENIDINLQNNRDTAKMITLFELNPLDDIHNCESEGNIFNLSQYDTVVYYGNLIVNVDYFNSLDDADANENPITNPGAYEGVDGEMIWVRITHTEVESLYATTSFTLHIHPNPVINPLQQAAYGCEVPGTGGSGEFDLSLNIGNITMNTPYLNVEYYLTEAQAELGDSSVALPMLYVGPSGTIYGRVINTQTGCYTVAPQELIVRATPTANELAPVVHCDANNDGFGSFNLAALMHDIAGNPVPTDIDVTFHHTLSDAQNFVNEIENTTNYTNAQSGGETLYVRVGYEYSSCAAIVPLELIVQSTPAVQTPSALEMCDVDNNGLELFDLTSKESEILNGLNPSDYTITYHTTQANAHSGSSAIGTPSSFSNTVSIVYVRVEDNNSGCYRVVSMLLRLLPTPEVDQPIADYVLCDDEVNDGFMNFDLTSRIPMITDGVQGLIVTFHYTQSDAASGSNPLPNNYQNVVANVQTIHVRVERADTGCYTLTTMNLVVSAGPVINVPDEPYVECSSNQGGGSLSVDLTYYGAMLIVGTDYSVMGYYETESNAINQTSPILAPTAYDGLVNNQITIWLRIADEATGCWSVVSIDIILEVKPFIPSNIPSLTLCDETGNRQDGSTVFDLTLQTPYLLDAQPQAGDYVVSYYTSEAAANAGAPAIGNPEQYTNTVNGQVVWFRIERTDSSGGCYAVGSFTLEVDTPMELNAAPDLSLCDASLPNDGTAVFDLTVNEGIILGGEVFGAEVKYHNSQAQAQVAGVSIANPESYNTNGVSSQVIWVSVTNEEGCISVTSFTIRVLPLPEPNLTPSPLEACEDEEFGGEGYFMLGDKDTEIANNDSSLLIQYYYSEADALAGVEGTEIPKDEPFYTGTTIVYVRVSTQPHIESETCFVVLELQLIVHEKPSIPEISTYLICMQHATGFHQFDLLEKNAEVLGNRPSADYTVKYYGSLADAEADFNPLAYQYTNTVAWLQTVWVRLEDNATGCYNVSSFDLRIEERVFAHMPESLEYCDIDGVNDGLTTIDLTLLDDEIKLIQLVPNAQLGVNYYASESDYANGIAIADPSNYTTVSYPQTIIAEVYQLIDWGEGAEPGMCRDTVTFEIEVIDAPEMNDIEDGVICFEYNREGGNIPTSYLMDTGLSESDHTFVWTRNGQVINGATSSFYEATQGGTYVVVVTSNATGCSASQTIVLEEAPAITIDIVHITDGFSDTNGIEVIVSPNTHTYEYALDEGAYQLSNIFLDVSPGEHTIWVRVVGSDTGAACPASKTVVILNYPKFFTPNGDGYNDTWNIWSLQSQPESKIYIFDRHGKLLKQISPNGEGWDGTFNGRDLPSTDYWFRVEYIEPNTGLNKEFRGHFSLKR